MADPIFSGPLIFYCLAAALHRRRRAGRTCRYIREQAGQAETSALALDKDGSYTSKEDVALYIHIYGTLPGNFITKKEVENAGWVSREGNLWDVAPGKSIGGSPFGNYEEILPDKDGRKWFECDINFEGGFRNAERLVYSNDGLIYYTADHYKTFEQIY